MTGMIIGKTEKIVLGALTGLIAISPLIFVVSWFYFFYYIGGNVESTDPYMNTFMYLTLIGLFELLCSTILHIVLLAIYLIHLNNNHAGDSNLRIIFGVCLFIMPFVAMPLYFLIYILPDTPPVWTLAVKQTDNLSFVK